MTLSEFTALCDAGAEAPPADLAACLQALFYARRGDWHRAHELAQDVQTKDGSHVHAYLHRVEGDISNARYWYSRAGRPEFQGSLEAEWEAIAAELL